MEILFDEAMQNTFKEILEYWKLRNEEKFMSKVFLWFVKSQENPFTIEGSAREIFFKAVFYYQKWRDAGVDTRRSKVLFRRCIKELFDSDLSAYYEKVEHLDKEPEKTNEVIEEPTQEVKQETENKAEEIKIETEEAKEVIEDSQPTEKPQEQIHVFGVVPENTAEIEENFAEKPPEAKREESVNNKPQSYNPNAKPPFFGKRKR